LKWALMAHAEVPQISEADLPGFLQIEAERSFPCDVSTLRYATSLCQLPGGKQQATFVGFPAAHIDLVEKVLIAAKLKPTSFALGLTALQPPRSETSNGVVALDIGESNVGAQVSVGGGVAALRLLEGVVDAGGGRRELHNELLAREFRITLGQLPDALRQAVRRVRVFGPRELARQLADEIELRLETLNLEVEAVSIYPGGEFGLQLPEKTAVSAALSLAAEQLADRAPAFEFLPPRPTAWEQFNARYSSGRMRTISMAAAAVFVLVAGPFLFQQWQLMSLQSRWNAISKQVTQLDALNQKIREYQPWSDSSMRALAILRQLTQAFPEDGVVSAKSVEIQDLETVTCTGTARDNPALLKVLAKLQNSGSVSDLKVEQIRGHAPMQFTFNYHSNTGGPSEN
jgi:hypothetical protein